jgi:hypothetical protein
MDCRAKPKVKPGNEGGDWGAVVLHQFDQKWL